MIQTVDGRGDPRVVVARSALPVAVRRAGDGADRAHRPRRQVPAEEVREGPRARLRAPEALRRHHGERLDATRMQLLDLYAASRPGDTGDAGVEARLSRRRVRAAPDPMFPVALRVHRVTRGDERHLHARAPPRGRQAGFPFAPGQFNMLYVFGIGEVPISISGDPRVPRASSTRPAPSAPSRRGWAA